MTGALLLPDTGIWIDYMRAGVGERIPFDDVVDAGTEQLVTCAPVLMELRMGANRLQRRIIGQMLEPLPALDLSADDDFLAAADIYVDVRLSGHTVRSSVDCLIAAIAERHRAVLLHRDVDFERIAAVRPLLRAVRADRPGFTWPID